MDAVHPLNLKNAVAASFRTEVFCEVLQFSLAKFSGVSAL